MATALHSRPRGPRQARGTLAGSESLPLSPQGVFALERFPGHGPCERRPLPLNSGGQLGRRMEGLSPDRLPNAAVPSFLAGLSNRYHPLSQAAGSTD